MIHFRGETVKAERFRERDPEDRRRNKGMSKLKYMLGALGLSMALIMTGCGAAGGSQNTDSSVAAEESSTSAETAENIWPSVHAFKKSVRGR